MKLSSRVRKTVYNTLHLTTFLTILTAITIYNVGLACLFVDAAVRALVCLIPNKNKQTFLFWPNFFLQAAAAFFSINVMLLARCPKIWDRLTRTGLDEIKNEIKTLLKNCGCSAFALVLIMVAGFVACVARGISAYLGTEVILGERFPLKKNMIMIFSTGIAAILTLNALLFTCVNMLTEAAKFLKAPQDYLKELRVAYGLTEYNKLLLFPIVILVWLLSSLPNAIGRRFFIKEFLARRALFLGDFLIPLQWVGQIIFPFSEMVIGLFTMGSSFKGAWLREGWDRLTSSCLFTFLMFGAGVSTWLAYSSLTIYDGFVDIYKEFDHPFSANSTALLSASNATCSIEYTDNAFLIHWGFVGLSVLLGIPATFAYFNYLLKFAKEGYDKLSSKLPSKLSGKCCCAQRFLGGRLRLATPPTLTINADLEDVVAISSEERAPLLAGRELAV